MAIGIFTAPERVERDGFLVCFAGEKMTYEEAARRGLCDGKPAEEPEPEAAEPEAADADRVKDLVDSHKLDELQAMADERGIEYPKGATKAVIADAIVAAERTAGAEG